MTNQILQQMELEKKYINSSFSNKTTKPIDEFSQEKIKNTTLKEKTRFYNVGSWNKTITINTSRVNAYH